MAEENKKTNLFQKKAKKGDEVSLTRNKVVKVHKSEEQKKAVCVGVDELGNRIWEFR